MPKRTGKLGNALRAVATLLSPWVAIAFIALVLYGLLYFADLLRERMGR